MQAHLQKKQLLASPARPTHVPFVGGRQVQRPQHSCVVVRAQADDDELEQRLAALKRAKGATPDKEGAKAKKRSPSSSNGSSSSSPAPKKEDDYTNETVHWEGGPSAGDLAFNIALGATLVAIPLSIGAASRAAFVKYKFTDRRVSVKTDAPWEKKQTDCAYQEVKDVRVVSRGLGAWGDMVIELNNGDKLELRSLAKFKELRDYVLARRDALGGGSGKGKGKSREASMMDLDLDDATALKKSGKGFA